jgi:hypothetical protein
LAAELVIPLSFTSSLLSQKDVLNNWGPYDECKCQWKFLSLFLIRLDQILFWIDNLTNCER